MAKAAKIKYSKSGITVNGDCSVTGSISATGGLSYTNITLSGNLIVQGNTTLGNAVGDTITVTGTPTFAEQVTLSKDLVVGTGISVTAGGLTVVAGGATVSAGNLGVTLGNITAAAGNITASLGDIVATAGSVTAGANVTATATVQGADVTATDDLTVGDDATIGGDLAVSGNASVSGNLGVTGILTCATFAPANITCTNITAGGTLDVTGTTTLAGALVCNGTTTLGNAAGDTVTVTGQIAGNLEFTGAATHQVIGEADQNIQITAAGTGDIVLATAGNATAVTVDNVAGNITLNATVDVDGVATFSANPVFDIAGACSITGTNNQNMTIASQGTGHAILTASNSAITIEDGAGGAIGIDAGAGTCTVTGILACTLAFQPGEDIDFQGAAAHEIVGVTDQHLTIRTQGTGDLILSSAGAGGLTVDGATDTIVVQSAIDSDDAADFAGVLAKSAGQGAVCNLRVAEGSFTTVGGGATETIAGAIPAGSLVVGVTTRVTTAITFGGGGANFDIGVAGATTRFAENTNPALDETTDLSDAAAATSPIYYKVATDIVLTADAGTFVAGGVLRWKVFYFDLTAPTS